jgi:large subunit ribosomal protein L21
MFAVIKVGGRQYRISPEQVLKVHLLKMKPGEEISVTDVMMIGNEDKIEIGEPHLNYNVTLEVLEHGRYPKVISRIFKRRGGMRRKSGHRQDYSLVKVKSIELGA